METRHAAVTGPARTHLLIRVTDVASARPMTTALLTYIALRASSLTVLAIWASHRDRDLLTILGKRFDAVHYVAIAEHGYSTMNLAFFPFFPVLIRAALVLPISAPVAALAIAWTGSLSAAGGIFKVGNHIGGRRTGLFLVACWAVLPHALVESMAYTEGLFTAFASWSLYFALRERWIIAGTLCCLGCLTRPTGIALVAALAVAATFNALRNRHWTPLLAPLIGCTGWLAYVGWVGVRLRRPDGWFWVQRTFWHSTFDGGRYNLSEIEQILLGHGGALELYVVTAVVVGAVLLLALSASSRQPLPLIAYSASVLVLTVSSNTGPNKARLLIPAFTLLLPAATALAKARTRDAMAILAVCAAASAWFGGYLALIWPWSP